MCKYEFKRMLFEFATIYKDVFEKIPKMVGEIDVIKSGA